MPDAPQGGGVEEVAPLGCFDCGLVYGGIEWIETSLPNDVWEKIAPREGGGGVLCITCIARRLARLGLRDVPVRFVGTEPLRCADERATLASQADAGEREGVEAALADLARVLVPATKAGLGAVESRKAKAIEVILSRLASLRAALATAEVRLTSAEGMAELWRNKYNEIRAVMIEVADENVALKAHRDALARRVGEALAIIGESGCYCDHDDPCDMTCITGRIEAALAEVCGVTP